MHAPISFSPPESGGTYFACIAYVEGVVFQLKLRGCAISRYILLRFVPSRVDSEGTLRFCSYSTIVLSSGGWCMGEPAKQRRQLLSSTLALDNNCARYNLGDCVMFFVVIS